MSFSFLGSSILFPYVRLDFQSFDPSFVLSLLSTMQSGGSRAMVKDLCDLMGDMRLAKPTHIGTMESIVAGVCLICLIFVDILIVVLLGFFHFM
jgi:hypothetical protein